MEGLLETFQYKKVSKIEAPIQRGGEVIAMTIKDSLQISSFYTFYSPKKLNFELLCTFHL